MPNHQKLHSFHPSHPYPYGMMMPDRDWSSESGYRFGFGGQEQDGEIAGEGNGYTAAFWQYDPRIGRRWNVDPVDFYSISRYAVFINNPIYYIDQNGNSPDDYKLGRSGEVTLVRKTLDMSDRLYATDDAGNVIEDNFIEESKKSINEPTPIKQLSQSKYDHSTYDSDITRIESAFADEQHSEEALELFYFATQNSNVEWSIVKGIQDDKQIFVLGTWRMPKIAPGFDKYGFKIENTIFEMHSHAGDKSHLDEIDGLYGDRGRYHQFYLEYGPESMFLYYVFMAGSGNVYEIKGTQAKVTNVGVVNKSYEQFRSIGIK